MVRLTKEEVRVIYVLMMASHETWLRQKIEDCRRHNEKTPDLSAVPTIHDLERAVDGLEAMDEHGLIISINSNFKLE